MNQQSMRDTPVWQIRSGETHFKVIVVSEVFCGKNRIERHKAINQALEKELRGGVHALTISVFSPDEWDAESNA